jgi:hypothetical protein
MGKTLRAKEEYILPNRGLHYRRGDIFWPDDALFLFLMADSPGTFEIVEEVKAVDAPPLNKMVRAPKGKK